MARIEAVVRRRKRAEVRRGRLAGRPRELEIRADQYQAFVGGQSLGLTRREFELLQLLAEVPGQVIEREEIYQTGLGLRDGPWRSLRRRLHQEAAPEAPASTQRTGATSTPTSASATASIRSRSAASRSSPVEARRRSEPPLRRPTRGAELARERRLVRRSRPRTAFTSRSRKVHANVTTLREVSGKAATPWTVRTAAASVIGDPAGRRGPAPVYAGRLEIRPADHAALVDGRPLVLTVRELQLLTELAHNAERVMTREELYETVWGALLQEERPLRRRLRGAPAVEARPSAAWPALHPHPHRHRLSVLAAGLSRSRRLRTGRIYILFTSEPHERNKLRRAR